MTFGYDICTYLQQYARRWVTEDAFHLNTGQLNITNADGQNALYLDKIPDDVTDCVCIFSTGGYAATRYHGGESPIDNPTVQIRVRHQSLAAAALTANLLYTLLDEVYHEIINERYYVRINCTAPPRYIGCDQVTTAGTAHEYVLNLYLTTKRIR